MVPTYLLPTSAVPTSTKEVSHHIIISSTAESRLGQPSYLSISKRPAAEQDKILTSTKVGEGRYLVSIDRRPTILCVLLLSAVYSLQVEYLDLG